MKKLLVSIVLLCCAISMQAQDVDIDKNTGLVTVDGKETFYLTPKNKQLLESDYSLENLQHKELAYLKRTKIGSDLAYNMVFSVSGNQCLLTRFGTFGTTKHLAKMIAGASLVQNNEVSEQEERKFIILHNGTFVKDPSVVQAPPERAMPLAQPDNRSTQPADISVKENKIYNNSELVGIFKRASENGTTTISVYNANDAMICKATHTDGNDNADWNLTLDGRNVTLLYNTEKPLEKLFKYLAEKGYL